ncbi:MFS transporter [Streptomyces netropsis]|uniref:MFS family permease n=1 Tax=Streptomyces netropsis TaxID=55404 RepID=A0A7W7PI74_STRNE|nr:MFS transporter [Streptomyces netropsis]MBB4890747.1 MFS family permease [Streptomyces netropsis]GGR51421.1 MFS transporter [Streptomyces netropsis]
MSVPTAEGPGDPHRTPARRALVAGSVGNFIEWYEFGAYGYFATVFAANFFGGGTGDGTESLIKTYASFALAFFFRPMGAALFGRIGDRFGRRPALVLALLLMTGSTTAIGLLPTYATLGAAAPWMLTSVRVLQGLSAGGEFGGAVSLMTESAPQGRRGLYGAWQSFTVALGLLAGAGLAAGAAAVLGERALYDWGWRVPFLLALPLGLVALWLRLRLDETPAFRRTSRTGTGPRGSPAAPGEAFRSVVTGIGRIMGWSAAGYTFLVVLPAYLQNTLGATFQEALTAAVLANVGFALTILPAGVLSDRVGRRPVMLTGAGLVVLLAFPLLWTVRSGSTPTVAKGLVVLLAGAVVGLMAGPGPAMLAEMFPTRVRCTGSGLAYSLANAVFAGCAGLIITELVKHTGSADIPAYYTAVTCAISAVALLTLRGDDHRRALRD